MWALRRGLKAHTQRLPRWEPPTLKIVSLTLVKRTIVIIMLNFRFDAPADGPEGPTLVPDAPHEPPRGSNVANPGCGL